MGLFSQVPEEPTDWTGLPSEPARRETEAERLADASPAVDALTLASGGAVESIAIPVAPVVGAPSVGAPEGDPPDGDPPAGGADSAKP